MLNFLPVAGDKMLICSQHGENVMPQGSQGTPVEYAVHDSLPNPVRRFSLAMSLEFSV